MSSLIFFPLFSVCFSCSLYNSALPLESPKILTIIYMVYGEVAMSLKKISAWQQMTPLVRRLKFIQFREISRIVILLIISTSSIPSLSNFHCVEMESSGIIPILYIFPLYIDIFYNLGNVLIVIFYNSVLSFSSVFIQIFIYLGTVISFFKKRNVQFMVLDFLSYVVIITVNFLPLHFGGYFLAQQLVSFFPPLVKKFCKVQYVKGIYERTVLFKHQ